MVALPAEAAALDAGSETLRLKPAPTVRHADVDGCRVLLDLGTETYRVLDPVATAMWAALIGGVDSTAALSELETRYAVDMQRLRSDLSRFAARCVESGLLVPADEPPLMKASAASTAVIGSTARAVASRPASFMRALGSIVATRRALAKAGFPSTYDRLSRLPAGTDMSRLAGAVSTFSWAENFFVDRRAPQDCLVRSLSLFRFLRTCGVPCEHVIGVGRFPFHAHAWVEAGGAVVLDESRKQHGLTPLARIENRIVELVRLA